jgi:hypothetical protein
LVLIGCLTGDYPLQQADATKFHDMVTESRRSAPGFIIGLANLSA